MSVYVIANGARISLRVNAMVGERMAREFVATHPGSNARIVDSDSWDSPIGRNRILSALPVLTSR